MKNKIVIQHKIESILFSRINNIYQQQLEQEIDNISYKLSDSTLVIALEGIITCSEKLLKDNNHLTLAKQVRKEVDSVIQPQIKTVIEDVLRVKVVDFLSDTTVENNVTGVIAVFEFEREK